MYDFTNLQSVMIRIITRPSPKNFKIIFTKYYKKNEKKSFLHKIYAKNRLVADDYIDFHRQIRENFQQIFQRVDNLNNLNEILRYQNRNANQELVFDSNYFQIRLEP